LARVEILGNTRSTNITNPGDTWKGVNTMKYYVSISSTKALMMGHNSGTYEGEIDVSKLTVEQRKFLVEKTHGVDDGISILNEYLLDSSGNLTSESIQAAMDETQKNINETFNRYVKEVEEKIHKYENDPEHSPGTLFSDYRCQDKFLSEEQRTIKNNLVSKVKALKERYAAEKQAKIDEFTTYILPLIEEYENGGERPEWDETLLRLVSKHLQRRIYDEDNKRQDQKIKTAEERKHNQLTEIVNKYGTDLQKRKWEKGMMKHKEAIHLLWINTFIKGNPLPINIWKLEGDSLRHQEYKIEEISDDEFRAYEKITAMYPDFSAQLMGEIGYDIGYDNDEYTFKRHFVRLSKKIGEYEIEADFILK
jgi:hypothetical protein